MRKLLIITLILLSITTAGYFAIKNSENASKEVTNQPETPKEQIPDDTPPSLPPEPTPTTITYDEKPAKAEAKYFEKIIKVKTELVYLAYPMTIEKENPPRLIVYSHGSNTTISKDLTDPFMKDMQMYGEYFTKKGYAFTASSLHGANWGSDQSVQDIVDQIKYVQSKYLIEPKVNILGFSMGGLPVFNYSFKYPKTTNSVALLAPTSRTYSQTQFKSIKSIPFQIWHGDKDVNVPYSLSSTLIARAKSFGNTNIKLETITNAGHFDIDTELKKEILNFYNKYE